MTDPRSEVVIIDDLELQLDSKNLIFSVENQLKLFGKQVEIIDFEHFSYPITSSQFEEHEFGWHIDANNPEANVIAIYYVEKRGMEGGDLMIDSELIPHNLKTGWRFIPEENKIETCYRLEKRETSEESSDVPDQIRIIEVKPKRCVMFSPWIRHSVQPFRKSDPEVDGFRECFLITAKI